jgi:hypothetical protein
MARLILIRTAFAGPMAWPTQGCRRAKAARLSRPGGSQWRRAASGEADAAWRTEHHANSDIVMRAAGRTSGSAPHRRRDRRAVHQLAAAHQAPLGYRNRRSWASGRGRHGSGARGARRARRADGALGPRAHDRRLNGKKLIRPGGQAVAPGSDSPRAPAPASSCAPRLARVGLGPPAAAGDRGVVYQHVAPHEALGIAIADRGPRRAAA